MLMPIYKLAVPAPILQQFTSMYTVLLSQNLKLKMHLNILYFLCLLLPYLEAKNIPKRNSVTYIGNICANASVTSKEQFKDTVLDKHKICSVWYYKLTEYQIHRSQASETRKSRYQRYLRAIQMLCHNYKTLSPFQRQSLFIINKKISKETSVKLHHLPMDSIGFTCPAASEILPCECISTDSLLDCSAVGSFSEMKQILNNASFPSINFYKFLYYPEAPNYIKEKVLEKNTFGPLSFEAILIQHSGLKTVESGAFNGSQQTLKTLISDSNLQLETFPFQDITDFSQITTLEIFDSVISSVPLMENIPTLLFFSLVSSQITSVQDITFFNLPALYILDLAANKLTEVGQNGLYLSGGTILIFLDHNQLTSTSPFQCNQPVILDEANNLLTTFTEEVYQPLLDNNGYIDVTSNPINCSHFGWVSVSQKEEILSDCW